MVTAAMIGIGSGLGLYQNLSSLFTPGMMAAFGWTRGQIATASGVGLLGGFAAPFLCRLRNAVIGYLQALGMAKAGTEGLLLLLGFVKSTRRRIDLLQGGRSIWA